MFFQSPPPEDPEPLFSLTSGIGPAIDFCVWVLEKDGLRVAPFDQHPDGDGSLRSLGMTAADWQSWLTRTALLVDQRYLWQSDFWTTEPPTDPLQELQQMYRQVEVEQPDLELPPFDVPAIVEQLDRHAVWQAQQLEKFQVALRQVYGDATPPNIWEGDQEIAAWQGSPEVAERLRELKAEYPFSQRERSWVTYAVDPDTGFLGIGEMAIDTGRLSEVLRPYWERLGVLELHLIAYPYPIEFAIMPNAVILSPSSNPRNSQQIEERLVQVVDRLVALNDSNLA